MSAPTLGQQWNAFRREVIADLPPDHPWVRVARRCFYQGAAAMLTSLTVAMAGAVRHAQPLDTAARLAALDTLERELTEAQGL